MGKGGEDEVEEMGRKGNMGRGGKDEVEERGKGGAGRVTMGRGGEVEVEERGERWLLLYIVIYSYCYSH